MHLTKLSRSETHQLEKTEDTIIIKSAFDQWISIGMEIWIQRLLLSSKYHSLQLTGNNLFLLFISLSERAQRKKKVALHFHQGGGRSTYKVCYTGVVFVCLVKCFEMCFFSSFSLWVQVSESKYYGGNVNLDEERCEWVPAHTVWQKIEYSLRARGSCFVLLAHQCPPRWHFWFSIISLWRIGKVGRDAIIHIPWVDCIQPQSDTGL